MTEDHIKLVRNFNIDWCDGYDGAPMVNNKRPYGNSDVVNHIHKILNGDGVSFYELSEYTQNELEERYLDLHRETMYALQIILWTGKFEPGTYVDTGIGSEWIRVIE